MTLIIVPFLPFELGESNLAQKVVESYNKYGSTGEYSFLKDCFAYLYHMAANNPKKKIIAAKASEALACKTINVYNDIYIKFFIANSVNSIFSEAQLEASQYWIDQSHLMKKKINEEIFNKPQSKEAGLVLIPL